MTIPASRLYRDYPLYIYFISLATIVDFATVDNINFLFIGFSFVMLTILIACNYKTAPNPDHGCLIVFFFFMAAVSVWNYSTARWMGLAYSFFFIFTFVMYAPLFKKYMTVERFRVLLKITFYLYFIGLIAGQFQHYFKALDSLRPLIGSMGILFEPDGSVRFFSFSSEPSYAAFIVVLLFYTYLKLDSGNNPIYKRENIFMFLLLLYMIFVFKSAYGIVLLGLMILDYVGFSSTIVVVGIIVLGALTFLIVNEYDIKALNRVLNIVQNIDLTDPHSLFALDFTAYYRVAPTLHFFTDADWTDMQFLFGHGPGASRLFVVPEIYGGYIGGEFLGGFMPAFFYDYGMVGGTIICVFLFNQVSSVFSFPTAMILLLLLNANFNTQLFWMVVLCFHLLKYYRQSNLVPHNKIGSVFRESQDLQVKSAY